MSVKTRDGQAFFGEIEVWLTNAGTKMGNITIANISQDTLEKDVSQGKPLHVTPTILGETIAVVRLGNRGEIEKNKVMFRFETPVGASVSLDGDPAKPTPCEFELRDGKVSIPATIELQDKRVMYASISVIGVNEWTSISKIMVKNIDEKTIERVKEGLPTILTYQLGGKKVLEVAIGNRPPE
jgi:hypothetical protein